MLYQNFIKKNEETIKATRKNYRKVRGNYDTDSTFTYGAWQAGLTVFGVNSEKMITVTSDWLQENEFEFLQSLMVSRQVHWVQDDGSYFPIVLDTDSMVLARERNGKLKNITFSFTMANSYL